MSFANQDLFSLSLSLSESCRPAHPATRFSGQASTSSAGRWLVRCGEMRGNMGERRGVVSLVLRAEADQTNCVFLGPKRCRQCGEMASPVRGNAETSFSLVVREGKSRPHKMSFFFFFARNTTAVSGAEKRGWRKRVFFFPRRRNSFGGINSFRLKASR